MTDPTVLKALTRETKALIMVSEFEARRMPMFQMRAVLEAIVRDDAERKVIIDLVDNDLRATGYPPEQIAAFLADLIALVKPISPGIDQQILATRKLRSPFAMNFDAANSPPPPDLPDPAKHYALGSTMGPGGLRTVPVSGPPPIPPRPTGFVPLQRSESAPPALESVTPPLVPPPPAPTVSSSGPRRSTMVFEAPLARPPSNANLQAIPSQAGQQAVPPAARPAAGERTTSRHTLMFSNIAPDGLQPPGGARAKPIILLADDDRRARMVFRMRLEDAGLTVIEVGSGSEAWEKIQAGGLSLAVLDMKMPGLHGLEVLSHMADKQMPLPVVICTAYDQLEDEFVVQTHPRLKYLVKPIAPEMMIKAIKELLGLDF